jgi:hypothetical protein
MMIKKEEIEAAETITQVNKLFESFWQNWVLMVCINLLKPSGNFTYHHV